MRIVVTVALAALVAMGACSGEERAPAPSPSVGAEAPPAEPTEPAAEAPPADPPLDPASACGRARACCEAFAAAIPNVVVESACVGPVEQRDAPDGDAACERMAEGWREALTLSAHEVPEACAAQ